MSKQLNIINFGGNSLKTDIYNFKENLIRKINTIFELEMFNKVFYSHLIWIAYNVICNDFRRSLAICDDVKSKMRDLETKHDFNVTEMQQYKDILIKTLYINDYVKFNYYREHRYPSSYNIFHVKSNHDKLNRLVSYHLVIRNYLCFSKYEYNIRSYYDAYLFQNVLCEHDDRYYCMNKYSGYIYQINSYDINKFVKSIFSKYTMFNKEWKDSNLKNLINKKIGYAHELLGNLIYKIKDMNFEIKYDCNRHDKLDIDRIDFHYLKSEFRYRNENVYKTTKKALNDNIVIYPSLDYEEMYGDNSFKIVLKNESKLDWDVVKIYL